MSDWTPVEGRLLARNINAIVTANLKLKGLGIDDVLGPNFGKAVRFFRKRKGWPLEKLAELAGFEGSHLENIEAGIEEASLTDASELAHALQIRLSQLIVAGEAPAQIAN